MKNKIYKKIREKEEGSMKRLIIYVGVVLLSVILAYGYADAISGACSNCHTMHNSQGGNPVDGSGPSQQLLNNSCVACHTTSTGQTNGTSNAPAVLHTTNPSGQGAGKTNAGGDFYWVATGYGAADAKGHNVVGISGADGIGVTPPGFDQAATAALTFDSKTLQVTGGAGWTGKQLTCSGTFGCHGARDQEGFGGLSGAHHGNTGGTSTQASSPTTIGNSFRFLAGIKGLENSGWNWSETASAHNEYYGVNAVANRQYDSGSTYANTDTISFSCAECHGDFHTDIANDSSYSSGDPWRRHPTDIALPNSGGYSKYNTSDGASIGSYSLEAPIARPNVPASSSSTVTAGTDIVMCLSCHRAHGSDQNDLLRWNYTNMVAGGSNSGGCFVCHTDKNAAGINP